MNLGLEYKVALVTGGSRGIGLACARALAENGCRVAVLAREPETGGVRRLRSLVEVLPVPCDVLKGRDRRRAMKLVREWCGGPDIVINNVGGGGRWGASVPHKTSVVVWRDVMEKNYHAAHEFTCVFLPGMLARKWGRIVTITSIHGREGGGRPWFTAAKAAEIAWSSEMARQPAYARAGITFNCIAPGPVEGLGWDVEREADPAAHDAFLETLPMGRLGAAEEVASIVLFLASERATWVNGACLAVDGGQGRAF